MKVCLDSVAVARNSGFAATELAEVVRLVKRSQSALSDIRVRDVRIDDVRLSVDLMDGRSIAVPLAWYPRLFSATAKQRQHWQIAGRGYGIHWPDIDEDLSTEGLLRGAAAPHRSNLGTSSGSVAKPTSRRKLR